MTEFPSEISGNQEDGFDNEAAYTPPSWMLEAPSYGPHQPLRPVTAESGPGYIAERMRYLMEHPEEQTLEEASIFIRHGDENQ